MTSLHKQEILLELGEVENLSLASSTESRYNNIWK